MIELLAKFKCYVDLTSLNEWEQQTDWSVDEINDFPSFKHVSGGTNTTIKKLFLTTNKYYKISFDVEFTGPSSFNSLRIGCGTTTSTNITSSGHYDITLQCVSNTYFSLIAGINSNLEVYNIIVEEIGYTRLYISDDGDILLNFSIKDIKEYGQNKDTYSREFKLSGKEINNYFFKNVFNINENSTYSFNQSCQASIVVDGITIKNGILRLENVIRVGNFYNYELTFLSEISGIFDDFGDKLLSDLDYSDINHYSDDGDIVQGWNTFGVGLGESYDRFVHPYICYGYYPFEGIRGKAYEPQANSKGMLVSDLFPAIGVRYLFKKCFEENGYSFDSDTLDDYDFNKLIIPYTNDEEKLNEWYVAAHVMWNAPYNKLDGDNVSSHMNNPATGKFYTTSNPNPYNGSSTIFTCKDSIQSLSGSIPNRENTPVIDTDEFSFYNAHFNCLSYNGTYQMKPNVIPGAYRCRKTGKYRMTMRFKFSSLPSSIYLFATRIPSVAVVNINNQIYSDTSTYEILDGYEETTWVGTYHGGYGGDVGIVQTVTVELDCEKDDQIAFKFVQASAHAAGYIYELTIEEYGYGNGSWIDFSKVVPENVKIKDFVSDVLKMFNLFVRVDVDNPKNLIIENYDNFYSGNQHDLTYKVDLSKEIKIYTPKDYSAKEILLKYNTTNDDTYNKYYNSDISDRTYGHKFLKINDYNEEDKREISLSVFTPTELVDFGKDSNTGIRQFVYSNISGYDKTDQNVVYEQRTKTTPRILYFNNITIASSYKKFNFNHLEYSTYPYAGHLTQPLDISNVNQLDLNFDTITTINGKSAIFFTPDLSGFTNRNVYNIYWRNYLNNYIDRNARIVELYANLTIHDINNIELNDTIVIDDTHYYINKIIDFSCSKVSLTKLELIKINDTLADVKGFELKTMINSTNDTSALNNNLSLGRYNNLSGEGSFVIGDNNSAANKSIIIGDDNVGGEKSVIINSDSVIANSGSTIINSTNVEARGDGVIIIGTSDLKTTKSNTIYIGGIEIENGNISYVLEIEDGGDIEVDGILNPYKTKEYHFNDSGENGNDIYDMNIWEIEDGGAID